MGAEVYAIAHSVCERSIQHKLWQKLGSFVRHDCRTYGTKCVLGGAIKPAARQSRLCVVVFYCDYAFGLCPEYTSNLYYAYCKTHRKRALHGLCRRLCLFLFLIVRLFAPNSPQTKHPIHTQNMTCYNCILSAHSVSFYPPLCLSVALVCPSPSYIKYRYGMPHCMYSCDKIANFMWNKVG